MSDFDWPAFLTARLDEIEEMALAASGPELGASVGEHWHWVDNYSDQLIDLDSQPEYIDPIASLRSMTGYSADGRVCWSNFAISYSDEQQVRTARHLAFHDPAYVLADIAAKRAIIKRYRFFTALDTSDDSLDDSFFRPPYTALLEDCREHIRYLCHPFADHPDYPKGQP